MKGKSFLTATIINLSLEKSRDMKQALELVDKAKIRDRHTQESDAILKFSI
ncbi:hypothetical protein HpBGD46_07870 [Helicobacter pylori]